MREKAYFRGNFEGLGWHAKIKRRRQGFLKSIGIASNCCDKQEDDDAGRDSPTSRARDPFEAIEVESNQVKSCHYHVIVKRK